MPFFTQQRFPSLWRLFQSLVGGTADKRALCLKWFSGQRNILEIGCSVGNMTPAFLSLPGISYTGIDVDSGAIANAQHTFASQANCRFLCEDLREFAESGERFDYITFAGICHHVDDELCLQLLAAACRMLTEDGIVVVVDPLLPTPSDPWLVRQFYRLDQGEHLRHGDQLERLLNRAAPLRLVNSQTSYVAATPLGFPRTARFGVYLLNCKPATS
jgi:cyclopropane fatty-acyl-phospholipid synthase-like methyltransferase